MCKSVAQGGRRCAADTRRRLEQARVAYDLAISADDTAYAALSAVSTPPDPGRLRHETVTTGTSTTLIALNEQQDQVGQITFRTEDEFEIELDWVEVDPDMRGQGIATTLVKRAAAGRAVSTSAMTEDGRRWIDSLRARTGMSVGVVGPAAAGHLASPAGSGPAGSGADAEQARRAHAVQAQREWEQTDLVRLQTYRAMVETHAAHSLTKAGAQEFARDTARADAMGEDGWDRQEYLSDVSDKRVDLEVFQREFETRLAASRGVSVPGQRGPSRVPVARV